MNQKTLRMIASGMLVLVAALSSAKAQMFAANKSHQHSGTAFSSWMHPIFM